ncbi:uncharacterized protein ARMOST_02927 [Armillaria ostoyae]|uniref:Uncharacterized protein n=1 Tax=Armillaria ostoyae TaxID=47428 RepID=A0A284QT53_ARMOS|nr:uncharacterized protein ARMOST_02927 [Armillaria ostoyae]
MVNLMNMNLSPLMASYINGFVCSASFYHVLYFELKVQVILVMETPMDIILGFHSTIPMNIIAHKVAISLYLKATFGLRINCTKFDDCHTALTRRSKYTKRGWNLFLDSSAAVDVDLRDDVESRDETIYRDEIDTRLRIQGCVADALNDVLNAAGIPGVFKWVDDHNILRSPIAQRTLDNGDVQYSYDFDLQTIFDISQPLGILWHDVSVKGHDFQYVTSYVGFMWDIAEKRVYLSGKKREKYLKKVSDFLLRRPSSVSYKEASSLHGTLQHVCFVCKAGKAYLPALSRAIPIPHRTLRPTGLLVNDSYDLSIIPIPNWSTAQSQHLSRAR